MIACYIIYSQSIDTFYVGITKESIESRLSKHNACTYGTRFTSLAEVGNYFGSLLVILLLSLRKLKDILR